MLTLIYGPQGCGKTFLKDKFQKHFEHEVVIDGLTPVSRGRAFRDDAGTFYDELPKDALILAAMTLAEVIKFMERCGPGKVSVIPYDMARAMVEKEKEKEQ